MASWGASRPPLGVRTTPRAGTNDFDEALSKKLQLLEGQKGAGSDLPVLRRKQKPRHINVEEMLEIPGEDLEGISRSLSWWDLPEEERMVRGDPTASPSLIGPRCAKESGSGRRAAAHGRVLGSSMPLPLDAPAPQARVWPGEDENGDALDSPFSIQSGATTPGAMTPPLDGTQLRPWTLSWVPPEELRLPGYVYEGAQTSPASSAAPSREATPRGPSRNLFFGNGSDAAQQQALAAAHAGASRSGDLVSPVSFHAHIAGLKKANEARAEALHTTLKRSQTLRSLSSLGSMDGDASSAFRDVQLTPSRGAPQKANSASAATTSGRPGLVGPLTGEQPGPESAR